MLTAASFLQWVPAPPPTSQFFRRRFQTETFTAC
jgi:hypothetical protein